MPQAPAEGAQQTSQQGEQATSSRVGDRTPSLDHSEKVSVDGTASIEHTCLGTLRVKRDRDGELAHSRCRLCDELDLSGILRVD